MSSDKGSFLEWPEGDGLLVVVVPRAAQLPGLFNKSQNRWIFCHFSPAVALAVKLLNDRILSLSQSGSPVSQILEWVCASLCNTNQGILKGEVPLYH